MPRSCASPFVVGDRDGTLWHRESDTGRVIGEPYRTDSPFWSVQFTADGKTFIAGTDDGAQVWDLGTHEMVKKLPVRGRVTFVSISPNRETVLLNLDGFAREWNFATDETIHSSLFQPEGGIDRIALSRDGKRVLVSGMDKVARLFDVSTGKQLGPSLGTRVRPVAFTPDDRLMAVGEIEGRIVLWEMAAPLPGTPEQIRSWVENVTRMELDRSGTVRSLTTAEVDDRVGRLESAGGSPRSSP
jgi:WD40 repeat protein